MAARLHFYIFQAVILLAPLPLGSNRPSSWSILACLVGLLCLSWPLVTLTSDGASPVPVRRIAVPLIGFGVVISWAWLQMTPVWPAAWADPIWLDARQQLGDGPDQVPLAIDRFAAATGAMRLLCYAGVMWLALQHGRSSRNARQMTEMLALGGGAYALYGLVVFAAGNETILAMPKWAYHDSLTATFVNRNSFATYAGLTLLCAIVVLMQRLPSPVRLRKIIVHFGRSTALYGLTAVLLAAALTASGSRAGGTSTWIAVVTLFFMRKALLQNAGPTRWPALNRAAVVTGLLTATAISILLWSGALDGDFADRKRVYGLTLDMIADRPLLGHGLGSFAARFAAVRPLDLRQVWTEAHDTYLELAFDLGIPAATLLLLVIIWLVARCIKGVLTRRRDALFPVLGVAASLLVGFHSLFDFSLQIPAITVTWATLVGMAVAQSWPHEPARRRPNATVLPHAADLTLQATMASATPVEQQQVGDTQ